MHSITVSAIRTYLIHDSPPASMPYTVRTMVRMTVLSIFECGLGKWSYSQREEVNHPLLSRLGETLGVLEQM